METYHIITGTISPNTCPLQHHWHPTNSHFIIQAYNRVSPTTHF